MTLVRERNLMNSRAPPPMQQQSTGYPGGGGNPGLDNQAKFDVLIDTVLTNFSESQISIQELLKLKDELLLHYLPPPLLFRVAVVFGQVYRSFSDLNTSVYEMLRLVKIYSAPWEKNGQVMKKIHDMYENKKQMLNIAIKRLAAVDKRTKVFARDKCILNWEKLFVRMSEAKGHGRRWKFQMDTFRKKAELGYEELVRWATKDAENNNEEDVEDDEDHAAAMAEFKRRRGAMGGGDRAGRRKSKKDDDDESLFDEDNFSVGLSDQSRRKKNDNVMREIDSDQELFSDIDETMEKKKQQSPAKEVAQAETQTEPDVENKITWTGEPNYRRFFIVRVFKPTEYNSKKIKFKLNYDTTSFQSNYFEPSKKPKAIEDKTKAGAGKKPFNQRKQTTTPSKEVPATTTGEEDKKLDLNRYEDFLFEMNDYFRRKDTLATNNENALSFEIIKSDEKEETEGYSTVHIDDIHTLDLPILYYKLSEDVQVIEEPDELAQQTESMLSLGKGSNQGAGDGKVAKKDNKKGQLAAKKPLDGLKNLLQLEYLTPESVDLYKMLAKRQPFTFKMYKAQDGKTGDESIGELPLLFFWIRKPATTVYSKSTGTKGMRSLVEELTSIDINRMSRRDVEFLLKEKGGGGRMILDQACSPIPIEPPRAPSSPAGSARSKNTSSKKDIDPEEMKKVEESYQTKIEELNLAVLNLENENSELKMLLEMSQQTAGRTRNNRVSFSTMRSNEFQKVGQIGQKKPAPPNLANYKMKKQARQDNVTGDFLERLKVFSEKSQAHHKDLLSKYLGQEAAIREQQMAVQHKLDEQDPNQSKLDDFCLPAVFMPYKSPNNVFNPRAHQYFHPSGSHDVRLTQPPTVIQLPPLVSRQALPVINLFELAKRYEAGEPDYYIREYVNRTAAVRLSMDNGDQAAPLNGLVPENTKMPDLVPPNNTIDPRHNDHSINLNFDLKRNELIKSEQNIGEN